MNDIYDDKGFSFQDMVNEDTEFIPLITSDEDDVIDLTKIPEELPILPIRNNVLFPGVVIPITVSRDKSIKLIQEAYDSSKIVGVVAQSNQEAEDPGKEDIHKIGTLGILLKVLKMPDGSTTAIIQGKQRFEINEISQDKPYFRAKVSLMEEVKPMKKSDKQKALFESLKELSLKIITESPNIPTEASMAIRNIESPAFLVNFICSNMNATPELKQSLLEEVSLITRAERVMEHLYQELQMLEMKNEIQDKVKKDLDQQQREFFLHQQIRTIQDELGENPLEQEIEELQKKAAKKKWSKHAEKHFRKELDKLQRISPHSGEYSVQLNYLDLFVELPWDEYTKDKFDLKRAKKILDRDHYGLEKVKERILEYLAVLKLKGDMKSPILCLYGPPGVGKTSLGKSIAEAVGRKYVRMSLGGVRDESEIRGHRKTYIGAMPGRVIQNIKKAGSSNPVFILDEVDKIGRDHQGDPSSALLEVLDPEQNDTFYDNYVEVDYDLSKVMFIATANSLGTIQPALRDRMEIIEVTGYTLEEKIEIAKRHLFPKQLKEHGLKKDQVKMGTKVFEAIINDYTFESGVRGLDKLIAKVVRYRAKQIAMEEKYKVEISREDLNKILGPSSEREMYAGNDVPGIVTGLAWTQNGGDILFIETSLTNGKGRLSLTGNLGDVMKESATIALEYLKSHPQVLGMQQEDLDSKNVHIHVPEGATPKDGPSAGITILTALASILTNRKVKKYIAMTGEITLRGKVLPVGGIKEKILAAKRAGIKEIILCEKNEKDVKDIKPEYLKGLKFHYVNKMEEVLKIALI
ncbi:MAG: endopeptidase La [Crocinitomicaceae bacterium]|nr:endopeptidase La [Crocinitomicaceae bacterium]